MKVWITKYALTSGVQAFDDGEQITPRMVKYDKRHYAHGDDWHISEQEAFARAETMRLKKIASLKKNLSAMEKLVFVP